MPSSQASRPARAAACAALLLASSASGALLELFSVTVITPAGGEQAGVGGKGCQPLLPPGSCTPSCPRRRVRKGVPAASSTSLPLS